MTRARVAPDPEPCKEKRSAVSAARGTRRLWRRGCAPSDRAELAPCGECSGSVTARAVGGRAGVAPGERLQQLRDALHASRDHQPIAVVEIAAFHGASETFGQRGAELACRITPAPQSLESGGVGSLAVHRAQCAPLILDTRECPQALLACRGGTLQRLRLRRADRVALLLEQLLQLRQQHDLLTQQLRQVFAAKAGIHDLLPFVAEARQGAFHLDELRGDVL